MVIESYCVLREPGCHNCENQRSVNRQFFKDPYKEKKDGHTLLHGWTTVECGKSVRQDIGRDLIYICTQR